MDEVLDRIDQSQLFRLAIAHSQKNHGEAFLHLRVLEELVEHNLRLGSTLEFDHNAHALAVGLIANIADVLNVFIVDEVRDALDQASLVNLVGDLSYDDRLFVLCEIFNRGFGAHHEATAASAVGFENSAASVNDSRGGEVWALHKFQNFRELRLGIVHQGDG